MILDAMTSTDTRHPDQAGSDPDERMSLGQRAFWTVVTTLSGVLLYLTVVCALPRGPIGY